MKILLAHNSLYYPSHGGGDKSNRLLMEALAERGHTVQVFSRLESFGTNEEEDFIAELAARHTGVESRGDGGVIFRRNGVRVFTATADPRLRLAFARLIENFRPDVILTSTDDPGALLLEVALRYPDIRVVYLVRATVAVPFGPDASAASVSKSELLRRVDRIVGVSEYVAEYVRKWSGLPAIHVPISLLEPGDYSAVGAFDNQYVLMVNPCAVKGISIFVALAASMPDVQFAAIPTWGTNSEDLALLARYPNIEQIAPVDDIAEVLRRTRVVLVPSVWAEARSRMVVESMIRGIPVIASDVGGLHEAKLGVEYLLPVNPILRYQPRVDSNMVPVAEIPPQDIAPWRRALARLLSDPAHYRDVAQRSRDAALVYAETLHCGGLESELEKLIRAPRRETVPTNQNALAQHRLSPVKQELLARRLRERRALHAGFFPLINSYPETSKLLFCFPWAGAGTSVYRSWRKVADSDYSVCPVLLPGREARRNEKFIGNMREMVDLLRHAIEPYASRTYSFFGHSMGAGIAFELTRELRRAGLPLPRKLIVSSAKAPQLRVCASDAPEPSDDELIQQLERLGGLPADPELIAGHLPVLRADTALYRRYCYSPEPPLDVPLIVYGGTGDVSLTFDQLEAWSAQTSKRFLLRMLPGGHFFPLDDTRNFLQLLAHDLEDEPELQSSE